MSATVTANSPPALIQYSVRSETGSATSATFAPSFQTTAVACVPVRCSSSTYSPVWSTARARPAGPRRGAIVQSAPTVTDGRSGYGQPGAPTPPLVLGAGSGHGDPLGAGDP